VVDTFLSVAGLIGRTERHNGVLSDYRSAAGAIAKAKAFIPISSIRDGRGDQGEHVLLLKHRKCVDNFSRG